MANSVEWSIKAFLSKFSKLYWCGEKVKNLAR